MAKYDDIWYRSYSSRRCSRPIFDLIVRSPYVMPELGFVSLQRRKLGGEVRSADCLKCENEAWPALTFWNELVSQLD